MVGVGRRGAAALVRLTAPLLQPPTPKNSGPPHRWRLGPIPPRHRPPATPPKDPQSPGTPPTPTSGRSSWWNLSASSSASSSVMRMPTCAQVHNPAGHSVPRQSARACTAGGPGRRRAPARPRTGFHHPAGPRTRLDVEALLELRRGHVAVELGAVVVLRTGGGGQSGVITRASVRRAGGRARASFGVVPLCWQWRCSRSLAAQQQQQSPPPPPPPPPPHLRRVVEKGLDEDAPLAADLADARHHGTQTGLGLGANRSFGAGRGGAGRGGGRGA